ncbi:MAG TPA: hypothetical protein VH880_01990 [Anaeromyxobacteraceae bacterium]
MIPLRLVRVLSRLLGALRLLAGTLSGPSWHRPVPVAVPARRIPAR